jgi:hypothetical protein
MADKNWRERLTEADLKNWQWADDRWVERDGEESLVIVTSFGPKLQLPRPVANP